MYMVGDAGPGNLVFRPPEGRPVHGPRGVQSVASLPRTLPNLRTILPEASSILAEKVSWGVEGTERVDYSESKATGNRWNSSATDSAMRVWRGERPRFAGQNVPPVFGGVRRQLDHGVREPGRRGRPDRRPVHPPTLRFAGSFASLHDLSGAGKRRLAFPCLGRQPGHGTHGPDSLVLAGRRDHVLALRTLDGQRDASAAQEQFRMLAAKGQRGARSGTS